MRTSRIARDTAKLVNALLPSRRSSGRTSARQSAIRQASTDSDGTTSSFENDVVVTSSSRKRKRDASSIVKTETKETLETKSSPAKAGLLKGNRIKKARRQPAKKAFNANGEVEIQPPPNWEEVYSTTAEMRKLKDAPVDTMGCESLADDSRSPRDRRYQTLIALMLSSQTKDTVNAVAMQNLKDNLPGGFTLESMLAVSPTLLNELISKVGFHNNKTRFIKQTAEILRDKFDSDIPDTIEGLTSLPGVGPKMAYLCMSAAWGRDEGIGVDVHVHRITNLWGWHKTNTPEETRAALEAWLPRDKWHDINHLLVGFGQTWCPPVGRKCGECKLAIKGLCPSAVISKVERTRMKKEDIVEEGDDGEPTLKSKVEVEVEQVAIKAEDISPRKSRPKAVVADIEDIGRKPR